ncbi:hypothetical protein GCM10028791_44210 [Echinicola sediminis]
MTGLVVRIIGIYNFLAFGQQSLDEANGLNDIKLNHTLQHYQESLQLITGEETIYQRNEWLQKAVKRNIKNGIQEGIYKEHSHLFVARKQASKLNLIFYKDELYKIRWTFRKEDFTDLASLAKFFNQYFTDQFGKPTDIILGDTFIWEEDKNYLQAFVGQSDFQIELRDKKIDRVVKDL